MNCFVKIYTKTGDDGKTSLFDNSRVWKSHERIISYGAVDELNSAIGIVISFELDSEIQEILIQIQNDLFIVGSDLANPDMSNTKIRTSENMITFLEENIDQLETENDKVLKFEEKPKSETTWINGGFFVLNYKVFNYIKDDNTYFEKQPMDKLAKEGELMAFKHEGFWKCMDNLGDKILLDKMLNENKALWKK